ncbi:MAG: endonuclease [Breznakibacter sp.]
MPIRPFFLTLILSGCLTFSICPANGQTGNSKPSSFMFYNTENLFDCFDDSLSTGDDEFLPQATRHWTYKRYKDKLNKISKVILAANGWAPPSLVGLCEIENRSVMHQLVNWTGLGAAGYRFVHFESPDVRGIDVALLYRTDDFRVLSSIPLAVNLSGAHKTRDILMVKGILHGSDTLHVFVNHWPSRLGGEEQSSANRQIAAHTLTAVSDSIFSANPHAFVLLMGDFNDGPYNPSILQLGEKGFVNLATLDGKPVQGSNKYRQDWELIDQILVSRTYAGKLAAQGASLAFKVVDLPFLLEKDETYLGQKPFRTFIGPVYHGGFSDHLPVIAIQQPSGTNKY